MDILIVDDDSIAVMMLQHALAPAGHHVRVARDAEQALEQLHQQSTRMVISDWLMPGMDGVTLCRHIRQLNLPQYVYFLLLTSWPRDLDVVTGLSAGADDILVKPFDPAELRVRIRNAERILNLQELATTQRALAYSEARLKSVFANSRDAILIIDADNGRIVEVNAAACTLFGYSHDELLSLPASRIRGDSSSTWGQLLARVQLCTEGVIEEIQCCRIHGEVFSAEASVSTISVDGRDCLLAIVRDISERKRVQRQLLEYTRSLETANEDLKKTKALLEKKNERLNALYRMAQTFVDNVSHEFRTPVTVVKEYACLLAEGVVGPVTPEQQRLLDIIAERADDLNIIVDDMLDGSRLDAGLLSVLRQPHAIGEIVDHVRPMLERKAAARDVELRFELAEPLPTILVDAEKAGRIVVNLVVNAIKFCGEPGRVEVRVERDPALGGIELRVTDNGPGIDPLRQAEVFDRFKQLGGRGQGSSKGFGLGLSIVKELVDLNLGTIRLTSAPGEGTTFIVTLPPADPRVVAGLYLEHMERCGKSDVSMTLVLATIDAVHPDAVADEVDQFLGRLLQHNDLILHMERRCWAILTPVPEADLDKMLARLERELDEANRNRLGERLPQVQYEILGIWAVQESRAPIQSFLEGHVPAMVLASS